MESNLGKSLGLDDAWAANIVRQVGNYGEMWERDITPLGLDRGQECAVDEGRAAVRAAACGSIAYQREKWPISSWSAQAGIV